MRRALDRIGFARYLAYLAIVIVLSEVTMLSQANRQPVNNLPNPYVAIENYFKLSEGRWWNSASAVAVDPDGKSVWIAERCSENTCAGSLLNPILKFDMSGNLETRFGEGMFNLPHGIYVDRDGNVWVTDAQGPDGKDPNRNGKGHVVYKFSPDGKVLLTLGKPGIAGNGTGALLNEPTAVLTASNGDIFVADGLSGQQPTATADANELSGQQPTVTADTVARIVKFTKTGSFIKSWGKLGSGPGEFRTPHGLALDSRGRLFVADRGNNRIQIFNQDGQFLEAWKQFGRPSGIFIDKNDILYVADSESGNATNPGWLRGIRIGSARDGKVTYFIPTVDPEPYGTIGGPDGVAADDQGNVYGAEVNGGASALKKYVKQ